MAEVILQLDCGCELAWDDAMSVEVGDYVVCSEHERDARVLDVIRPNELRQGGR